MIFGWMSREHYLEHYDPRRWPAAEQVSAAVRPESKKATA
jgi:hypothetical protein